MNKRILVIAAHPDDELLGCGGTVARHVSEGDTVWAIIACEGESLRYSDSSVNMSESTEKAAKILGIERVCCLGFPDQKLDTFCLVDIITPIEKVVDEFLPNIIYCQNGTDINRDHKVLFEAAEVAIRPVSEHVEEIYMFYTLSSTEWSYPRLFVPDTWVDISSEYLEKKLQAFACYKSEVRDYPHPRSTESVAHVAHFFGNQCCIDAAEAFQTVRRIRRK